MTWRLLQAIVFCAVAMSVSAETYYVDAGRIDDSGDGQSWATAKHTIQAAVDIATIPGSEILVSNGVYSAGGGVTPGHSLSNRVAATNYLIIRGVNGPSATVIDGGGASRGVYLSGGGSVSGFTITNCATLAAGNARFDRSGGGIFIDQSGMASNCVVTGCTADRYGGGAFANRGGRLVDCQFRGNTAQEGPAAVFFTDNPTATPAPTNGMVYVEGGTFTMGDTWGDGDSDELPTHSVTISGFSMSKYEVTNDEMVDIMNWAEDRSKLDADSSSVRNANGNSQELLDLNDSYCQISWNGSAFVVDAGKGDYPCVNVTWYGATAYCNYRSEREGLTPCYDLSDWSCDWDANGYRLPTEAEWEYAAKGGRNGSYTKYSGSDYIGSVAWYNDNSGSNSHEVGTKADNELGIHDMSGNVREWCNDRYDSDYYGSSPASNPKGPATGSYRVLRGGSWVIGANYCRVADRAEVNPDRSRLGIGFRCVR